jgi:RNA polymerase sigma-70 factor (ECF subfamily)
VAKSSNRCTKSTVYLEETCHPDKLSETVIVQERSGDSLISEMPNSMDSTSASLLEKLRQPEAGRSWDRFVFLYTPLLRLWAARLGTVCADTDDLLQDVFTTLVQKLPNFQYDPKQRFRAWLWTVFANKARERLRGHSISTTSLNGQDLPEPNAANPTDEASEREYRDVLVRRAMEMIQPEFKPAIWAVFWECVTTDNPAAEIGARLGFSTGAVYQVKSRTNCVMISGTFSIEQATRSKLFHSDFHFFLVRLLRSAHRP